MRRDLKVSKKQAQAMAARKPRSRQPTHEMVVLHTSPRRGEILSSSSSLREIYTSLKTIRGAESIYATTARRPDSKEEKSPQQELEGKSSISAPVEKEEERSTSEYAQPWPAKRESENQYAPLCVATQNKPQDKEEVKMGDPGSNSENNSPNSLPNISTSHSPCGHDSNNTSAMGVTEEYRGKELCLSHWKVFLAVGVIVSVVLVVVVLLLGIAAAGLSGSSENTERYRELEEAALGMAGLIERLETQLNTSTSALNELRSNSETLDRRISDIQRELQVQKNEIDNRIDRKLAEFKVEQEASVDAKINSEIDQLNLPMLEEAIKETEINITILKLTLMSSEERLNTLLQDEISNREQLTDQLRMDVDAVQADIKSLNTSTIPAYCNSNVYKGTADNASEATSPRIPINVVSHCNTENYYYNYTVFPCVTAANSQHTCRVQGSSVLSYRLGVAQQC